MAVATAALVVKAVVAGKVLTNVAGIAVVAVMAEKKLLL